METLKSIPGISPEEPPRSIREAIHEINPQNWEHEDRLKAGRALVLGAGALMAAVINHQPVTQMAVDAFIGHSEPAMSQPDAQHEERREFEADFSDLVRDFQDTSEVTLSNRANEMPVPRATDTMVTKPDGTTTITLKF